MRNIVLAALAASCLSACATTGGAAGTIASVGLAVQIAQGTYCTAVSEEGKKALRALVSGGQKVIACPEGAVITKAAP